MMTFKRHFKGYWPSVLGQGPIGYYIFSAWHPVLKVVAVAGFLFNAILLIRFITTTYLTIDETSVTIIKKRILIDEIKQLSFSRKLVSAYGKIETKDGRKIIFRDEYLSDEARA